MRKGQRAGLWAASILALVLGGCQQPVTPPAAPATITVTEVGYIVDSIPRDYYVPAGTQSDTCSVNFWIYCTGGFTVADVATVRVYLPGGAQYWTLSPASFDPANGCFASFDHADVDNTTLRIGTMEAVVTLKNGNASRLKFEIGAPGALTARGYTCVRTPETTGVYANATPALGRAVVNTTNDSLTASGLTFNFTVNDPNAVNGIIYFYDNLGGYVGKSSRMRDPGTGAKASWLNNGVGLYSDNRTNSVSLVAGSTIFAAGKGFADIRQYNVLLCDGKQYEPQSYGAYDHRSFSATALIAPAP